MTRNHTLIGPPAWRSREEPDGLLLQRFVTRGDEEAFALLVHRHGRTVLHVCQRILGHSHDAEDAFQATFLVLARKAGSVSCPEALASWLCGVSTRVALRLKSQRSRRHATEQGGPPVPSSLSPCLDDNPHDPPGRFPDPAEAVVRADEDAVMVEELGQLPDKYRAPLVLCYLEGQTTEEAAAQVGCPVGTFKSRLAKGRDLLRVRLTRRGLALSAATVTALLIRSSATAAVPPSLLESTARLAQPALASTVPPHVARLVRQEVKAMLWRKLLPGAVAGCLALVAVVAGLLSWPAPAPSTPAEPPSLGTLIVVNQRDATATLIDVRTARARATVRIDLCTDDRSPCEVAVSPSGKTAAVANFGLPFGPRLGNTIVLVDVATGHTNRSLILGSFRGPRSLHWLDEGRLLCTSESARAVIEIDTTKAKIVRALKTGHPGPHLLAVSPDGQRAYVANGGADTVTVFDLARGEKVRDVVVGKGPTGLALSPDGRRLWVGSEGDRLVRVIDANELRIVTTLSARGSARGIAFTPDGRMAAVVEQPRSDLALYDTTTLCEVKRIRLSPPEALPDPSAVSFSPDGRRAYCTLTGANAVIVADVETGEVIGPIETGAGPRGIVFSPVGPGR